MATLRRFHSSVVIPAFNEGDRLPPYLDHLVRLGLVHDASPVELIVVDDGSAPAHASRHRRCVEEAGARLARAGSRHAVRLVASPANQGKGSAIRLGWDAADPASSWLGFLDADGAIPADEFWRLVGLLGDGHDLLAGSRILMAGRTIRRSAFRHVQGRVFATLAERAFRFGFYDTQCGIKFVRAAALRPHLGVLRERGWLLDVEVLALLQQRRARMREEPIDWIDPGGTKVRFGIDALRMMAGLRRIKVGLGARLAAAEVRSLEDARRLLEAAPAPEAEPEAAAARR